VEKIIEETGRPQMTIWRMRIACWRPRATTKHSGCVIPIALPLQQWLQERASVLCYTPCPKKIVPFLPLLPLQETC
jgi:hypothetical protein